MKAEPSIDTGRRRLTVVGPTAPTKGGIAQHTDALVERLVGAGHDVLLETWAAQYPDFLYPGTQEVGTANEPAPRSDTDRHRSLRWYDPISWFRAGRRARTTEIIVIALVVPLQVVAFVVLITVARWRNPRRPQVVVIAHNVLPHEAGNADRFLVRVLLRRSDRLVAHTAAQADLAAGLGAASTVALPIPPHLDTPGRRNRVGEPAYRRVGYLGIIRDYKGVDVLIDAAAQLDDVHVRIHGECWIDADELRHRIGSKGLEQRVLLDDRFVPDDEVADLFDDVDALVLPYRSGTASQLVLIAHRLGLPVVATSVGSFPDQITDGTDGILCIPDDASDLARAIRQLTDRDVLDRLRAGAFAVPDADHLWPAYLDGLLGR